MTSTSDFPTPDAGASLDDLVRMYATGILSWPALAGSTGLAYGDVLVELGKRGLALPRVSPVRRPEQDALFERVLGGGE